MRTFPAMLVTLLLTPFLLPLSAQEVRLEDYRIRRSSFSRTDVGADGNFHLDRGTSYGVKDTWKDEYQVNGQLSTMTYFASESLAYVIHGEVNSNQMGRMMGPQSSPSREVQTETALDAGFDASQYLSPGTWFFGGNGSLIYQTQTHRKYFPMFDIRDWSYNRWSLNGSMGVHVGFGQVRSTRSVVQVIRIVEDLKQDGVLLREMAPEEVVDLAERLDAVREESNIFDRPQKHLNAMIFNALLQGGIIAPTASIAYETERVNEVMQQQIFPRLTGWQILAGPGVYHQEEKGNDLLFGPYSDDDVVLMATGTYGYPFSPRLHWTTIGSFWRVFKPEISKTNIDLITMLSYEMGERHAWEATIRYQRQNIIMHGGPMSFTDANPVISADLYYRYFLEDNLMCVVHASYVHTQYNDVSVSGNQWSSVADLTFGLNYRLE